MDNYIDLNCDMGEGFGKYRLGGDDEIIKLISSASVACGFHAGDPNIMDHTVALAKKYGVGVGAHPGYFDLMGFGRRFIDVDRKELMNLLIYQLGALAAFCKRHGVELQHFKPHGALGNLADSDENIANYVADAVLEVYPAVFFLVKPNSRMHRIAVTKKLRFALEIYADRAYNNDLSLVSRKVSGAVISDSGIAVQRVIRMVTEGKVVSIQGQEVSIKGESICVHGDTPAALDMIKCLRQKLEGGGISIRPFSRC